MTTTDDDLERRLRDMYGAVAERTDVTPPADVHDVRIVPITAARRRTAPRWSAAAAAVLLIVGVGALTVLTRSGPQAASTTDAVHILPIGVPDGYRLISLDTTAERDVLVYGLDDIELTFVADRARPGSTEGGVRRYERRVNDQLWVTVVLDGPAAATVDDATWSAATEWIAIVPVALWEEASAFGGFGTPLGAIDGSPNRRARSANGIDVELSGSLQDTSRVVWVRSGGVGVGWTGGADDQCFASMIGGRDSRHDRFVVTAPPGTGRALVPGADGEEWIDLAPVPFGLPLTIGQFETPRDRYQGGELTCEPAGEVLP